MPEEQPKEEIKMENDCIYLEEAGQEGPAVQLKVKSQTNEGKL